MALNWALSVKANCPDQPLALIYTPSAIEGIEPLIDHFFTHKYNAGDLGGSEQSFHLKTQLYDICQTFDNSTECHAERSRSAAVKAPFRGFGGFLYMDADTIILPGQKITDYLTELCPPRTVKRKSAGSVNRQPSTVNFVTYCNDIYKYSTQQRLRADYTFWCHPQEAKQYWQLSDQSSLPQLNTSFIFFRKSPEAALIFDKAKSVWADTGFKYQPYKGVKPDELCFNIACAILNSSMGLPRFLPPQVPYRPVYFQCFTETNSIEYLLDNYRAMGFAGTETNPKYLFNLYNQFTNYYRELLGVNLPFYLDVHDRVTQDPNAIQPTPIRIQTITRGGDLPNSEAGAFNPSAIRNPTTGRILTILRKEPDFNIYKSKYDSSAIAHVMIQDDFLSEYQAIRNRKIEFPVPTMEIVNSIAVSPLGGQGVELIPTGFPLGARLEDFRFIHGCPDNEIWVSHTMVTEYTTSNLQAQTVLSKIEGNQLIFHSIPALPIKTGKAEKNWAFFFQNDSLYCIYSLSPYLLFVTHKGVNYTQWTKVPFKEETTLSFFHKGQFLCNSTNPILIPSALISSAGGGGSRSGETEVVAVKADYYLMLFHTKESSIYYQGAVLINAETLRIDYYTRNSILIKHPSKGEGMHRGLIYVSGLLAVESPLGDLGVRVYFGEGDSHSAFHDYNAQDFISSIIKNSTDAPASEDNVMLSGVEAPPAPNNNLSALSRLKKLNDGKKDN